MNLSSFSRKGGQARSARKTRANRAKATAFWRKVRAGDAPPPRRYRKPPTLEEIRRRLAPYCRRHDIVQLDIFGSLARNEARIGSDVDLVVTFRANPGLRFFSMAGEMSTLLGVPVHLLTRESLDHMPNQLRRRSILADVHPLYHADA